MFKITCLILVFIAIKYASSIKCYQCGEIKKLDKRAYGDMADTCKDKNDNGTEIDCPKEKTYCVFSIIGTICK